MLIKEYRILLPITLEEYKIAHLYMVAKKSREESEGPDSGGVEILVNEPYSDGPGGSGQFTHKLFHFGAYLPPCLKSLTRVASQVHERSWNAYPQTKSIYSWPRMEKFSIEIDTIYTDDCFNQENIFQLSEEDLNNRIIDIIDIVNDPPHGDDCKREEDPKVYISNKSGRGPLTESWIKDISANMPETCEAKPFMRAYKLCKVEFKYRFVQSKVEKWIHDNVLRKNILQGCRQVWAWQDEWIGLTIDDIRGLEDDTQALLSEKMSTNTTNYCVESQDEEIFASDLAFPDFGCLELLPSSIISDKDNGDNLNTRESVEIIEESTVVADLADIADSGESMQISSEELCSQVGESGLSSCPLPSESSKSLQDETINVDSNTKSNCQHGLM